MTLTTIDPSGTGPMGDLNGIERRIESLLAGMSLEEKIGQMTQVPVDPGNLSDRLLADIAAGRVGSVINSVGEELNNRLQQLAVEQSRLGIPLLIGRDVIHGFKTVFPIPLGQAASWNPERVRECARIAAAEAASAGINWTFAPMIDVARDPRWGRIAESLGEDPWLTGMLAVAMVEGFQGQLDGPDEIAACVKHFAGYGASESGLDYNTTLIPENELRNVYLPPFKAAVDAGAVSLMTSFSDLNGVPATANEWLLRVVLRQEWGFDGLVVSDWESVRQLEVHGLTAGPKESALAAAAAGVDMEMASTTFRDHLAECVAEGRISETALNVLVANILRLKFRLGLFDRPYTDPQQHPAPGNARHLEVARQAAAESLVLLKNEGDVLPLDPERVSTVAVIGPLADSVHDQLGTWIFDGDPDLAVTPLQALQARPGLSVCYARALATSRSHSRDGFEAALDAAKDSDAVVLFLGEESILSGEAHCRADIRLPGAQEALIEAVAALGKPTVLVILAGRPLALESVVDRVPAILYAWHPGTLAGPAIVDVLFGAVSPSGKLPVSFPRVVGQIPLYYNHRRSGKPPTPASFIHMDDIPVAAPQTSVGNTAFHLDVHYTPMFPFGHGLSYGRFDYRDLCIESDRIPVGKPVRVSARVTNAGPRAATEVVQLYVRDRVGSVTRPVRELKGFQRIHLQPGESTEVHFVVQTDDLAFHGRDMTRGVEPGEFDVWIGGSSAADLGASFELVER